MTPAPLFVMKPDGSDQHQVGTLAGRMPTWSPDGKQIAYVRYDSETNPCARRSGARMPTAPTSGSWCGSAAGYWLAFHSRIDWRVR